MKVLVIDTAFLGDVVFTQPLVEGLGRAGCGVDLVTRPRLGALLVGTPGLRRIWEYDKRGADRGAGALWRLGGALRVERYDLVLGAHPSLRTLLLARLAGGRCVGWRRGYDRVVQRRPLFVEDKLDLARAVGLGLPTEPPRIRAHGDAPRVSDGAVALAPGARWGTKRWPHFGMLARQLRASGRAVVWTGTDEERGLADRLPGDVDAFGLDLPGTASLLRACAGAVTGDSGLGHLARGVGTPTVMLFGPTDAARQPPDPLRLDLCHDVPCRPCSPHGPDACPRGHHACLRDLPAERVSQGLQRLLGG